MTQPAAPFASLYPGADRRPGFREPVLRLTAGFSGLKFSLTRALAGPGQRPVLQFLRFRRRPRRRQFAGHYVECC